MRSKNLRNRLEQKKGQRFELQKQLADIKKKIRKLTIKKHDVQKALTIMQEVARKTQEELKYRISEPVTLAIRSIFVEDPHSVHIEFPIRREKTEIDIYFKQNEKLYNPLKEGAGGMTDVASFAFRPALLTLHHPPLRRLLILDEPFKHLDQSKHYLAGELLSTISKELNIQIIMTTHSKKLSECANKIIEIEKKNNKSYIRR